MIYVGGKILLKVVQRWLCDLNTGGKKKGGGRPLVPLAQHS